MFFLKLDSQVFFILKTRKKMVVNCYGSSWQKKIWSFLKVNTLAKVWKPQETRENGTWKSYIFQGASEPWQLPPHILHNFLFPLLSSPLPPSRMSTKNCLCHIKEQLFLYHNYILNDLRLKFLHSPLHLKIWVLDSSLS